MTTTLDGLSRIERLQIAKAKRTARRKREIINAARAGISRYTHSSRGLNLLGVRCHVRTAVVGHTITIKCKDGEGFQLTLSNLTEQNDEQT